MFPLSKGNWKKEILFLKNLREVLGENKNLSNINLVSNFQSKQDQRFRKFLENKKIVIVSPSPVDKKDGYEIDKVAVRVRKPKVQINGILDTVEVEMEKIKPK